MKALRSKCFSAGRDSWNDPEQLGLKVMLALVYMAGLVAFQRYTGLLDLKQPSNSRPVTSHDEAIFWLKSSQHLRSPIMRSLLSLNSTLNETVEPELIISNTSSNNPEAAPDPQVETTHNASIETSHNASQQWIILPLFCTWRRVVFSVTEFVNLLIKFF